MSAKKFTGVEITEGFKGLEEWLTKLSIMTAIIKPYYFEYDIINAHPFVWMLNKFIFHLLGQVGRCCFDRANKDYKTISVSELHKQIKLSKKYLENLNEERDAFYAIDKQIDKIKYKYEEKLSTLAGKYYALCKLKQLIYN